MPYSPEYLELWTSLEFENADKRRLYSYQTFQGRDRKRQTDELFWRNSNELGIDLSGLGFVIDNTTGEITLVFDGTGDNPAEFYRWLTFTDGTNSIDAANGADVFTFEGLNDATVTVDPTNKKVSIDVTATGTLQNLIETINSDGPGSFVASSPTDSIDILGSNGVVTKIVGSVRTITGPMSHREFTGDTGTYSATSANSTFNILGGTGITTTVSGNTVTIDSSASLQNVFTTINSDDVNTITALTPTSSFNVLGGTDITTSISGNSITIDYTGTGGTSLWTEDTGSGYLYPSTLTHKVGINTNTPAEQLTVKGVTQIQPEDETILVPVSVLKFKNTHHTFTTLTSSGGDPLDTTDVSFGNFRIENDFTKLYMTHNGNIYQNTISGSSHGILANPAFSVYSDYANTGTTHGLEVVTDDTANPTNIVLFAYNEDTTAPSTPARNAQSFIGDGTVQFAGYRSTNNPSLAAATQDPHCLMGFSDTGNIVKAAYFGKDGSATNTLGEKTITHGCPVTPSVVLITKQFEKSAPIHPQTVGEQVEVIRGSINSTSFQVRITDSAGGPVSNLFRTVYFMVIA